MRGTHSLLRVLTVCSAFIGLAFLFQRPVRSYGEGVVINEVMYDPAGIDTGEEWIELFNPLCVSVDLSNFSIGAAGDQYILPSFTLASQSFVTIHWRSEGTNSDADLYTGTADFTTNMGNTAGSVSLFNSTTQTTKTLIDFVQYGRAGQSWEATAVNAGLWTSGEYVLDVSEESSIGRIIDGTDTDLTSDWQGGSTTTQGGHNNTAVSNPCIQPTATTSPTITLTTTQAPTSTVTPTPTPVPLVVDISVVIPNVLEVGVPVSVSGIMRHAEADTIYSLKFELQDENGNWYGGKTLAQDGVAYLAWNSSWSEYPTITTDSNGDANFSIQVMAKEESVYGDRLARVKIRSVSSEKTNTSNESSVMIHGVEPIATTTFIPTPTATPTPKVTATPTVKTTLAPVITLTPTVTPTLYSWSLVYILPTATRVSTPFTVPVKLESLLPYTKYYVKFDASDDSGKRWYAGKTLGADGETYLPWNSDWTVFPIVQTDGNGDAELDIVALIKEEVKTDSVLTRVKVGPVNGGTVMISGVKILMLGGDVLEPTIPLESTSSLTPQVTPTVAQQDTSTPTNTPTAHPLLMSTIENVRTKALQTMVKVEGVVTVAYEILGSKTLYIADTTGGIKLSIALSDSDAVVFGDKVRVTGELRQSYNETYIKVADINDLNVLGHEVEFDVTAIKTGDVNENSEGKVVVINGKVDETSGDIFYVNDGSGRVKVLVKESTGIDKPYMRVGYYARVTGVVSQYKDTYRILPRYQSDVVVSKQPIGYVLSKITELPDTGGLGVVYSVVLLGLGIALLRVNVRLSKRMKAPHVRHYRPL